MRAVKYILFIIAILALLSAGALFFFSKEKMVEVIPDYEVAPELAENRAVDSLSAGNLEPERKRTEDSEMPEEKKESSSQAALPGISVVFSSSDRQGQLVEHIFSVNGIPSPKAVAFNPNGSEIWVVSLMNKSRGIIVLDALNGTHKADIVLPGGGAVELVFNNDGTRLYASQMETARVFEIDTEKKNILRTFLTGSSWTKVLALSPDEGRLYASNWVGNNVSVIDLETGELLKIIPTVRTPRGIYATKSGHLYVAGFENGEIQKIYLETGESQILHRTGGAMRHIVGDEEGGALFFSDMAMGMIYVLDLLTDTVAEFARTDINPNTIALSPDGKILIVSNRGRNHPSGNYYIPGPEWGSVLVFDAQSGEMLDALIGGNQPTALHISPDNGRFAYSNFLDREIKVYKLPSHNVLKAGGGGRSAVYKLELEK